jgi:hypothetical protein
MFFDPDKNKIYMTNTMLYRSKIYLTDAITLAYTFKFYLQNLLKFPQQSVEYHLVVLDQVAPFRMPQNPISSLYNDIQPRGDATYPFFSCLSVEQAT